MNKEILHAVLARTDALWVPHRWHRDALQSATAIHERRRQYATQGVRFIVSGNESARKLGQRALDDLAASGLIHVLHTRGHHRGVKLSPAGDERARVECPTKTVSESWHILNLVETVSRYGRCNSGFVLENDVLGIEDTADLEPFAELADHALPLLANGLLTSASDGVGRLGYRVTSAGHAALSEGPPPKSKLPPYDRTVGEKFIDEFCAAMRERNDWTPTAPNAVWVPLGAGNWMEAALR